MSFLFGSAKKSDTSTDSVLPVAARAASNVQAYRVLRKQILDRWVQDKVIPYLTSKIMDASAQGNTEYEVRAAELYKTLPLPSIASGHIASTTELTDQEWSHHGTDWWYSPDIVQQLHSWARSEGLYATTHSRGDTGMIRWLMLSWKVDSSTPKVAVDSQEQVQNVGDTNV